MIGLVFSNTFSLENEGHESRIKYIPMLTELQKDTEFIGEWNISQIDRDEISAYFYRYLIFASMTISNIAYQLIPANIQYPIFGPVIQYKTSAFFSQRVTALAMS